MNWNLLRSLIAVQKSGGVRKAARKLGVSQPALSAQLKNLEADLGVNLFHRKGRQIELNRLGLKAVQAGYRMSEIFETLGSEIRAASLGQVKSITFAVERDLDRPYFVQVVSRVLEELDPKPAQVRIQAEFERPILEDLRSGKIDFAFTSDGPEVVGFDPFLTVQLPIVAVGSARWKNLIKAASSKRISDQDLLSEIIEKQVPMIFPSKSCPLYGLIRTFFEGANVAELREIDLWPMAAVVRGVTEGLGISLVPIPFIYKELDL